MSKRKRKNSKMAQLLSTEVPLKKRKIKAQSPDQGSSCGQVPVSLLNSTQLLLQIPPNSNTTLPVWEYVNNAQGQLQWNVTPFSITIQITPATTVQKAQSSRQFAALPQPQCKPKFCSEVPVDCPPMLCGRGPSDDGDHPSFFLELAAKTFCTRSCELIYICDNFLAGCCPYKLTCKQHHTPYPFHWQLRRQHIRRWVNVSLSAQVKLEKLYCDPSKETIQLQHKTELFTLDLSTMKVSSEEYCEARRLSSNHDPEFSPNFPAEWSIYWWNDSGWEKYENDVARELLGALEAGETNHGFFIGKQLYEVDFNCLTQTNLTTGFKRKIKWRPTFRSPFSIKSNLKTVVLCKTDENFGQVLPKLSVDPLQEFSSWYPPVWTLCPDQGFSLVEVPPNSKAYQSIHCLFHSTLSEFTTEIISIQQVQNVFQWDKYRRQKYHMQSRSVGQTGPLERHLFHGTTEDSAKEICQHNFDPRVSGKNGVVYGQGSYFARDASCAFKYGARQGKEGCQHMFLAKVLVGEVTLGNSMYSRPPRLNPTTAGCELYDSCVNQISDPSKFVVFDNCQCYPYFLIKFKTVSGIVDICE
ncbi:hypothetical protein GJAV_G00159950 [Gymnothorax javanicus]|nr:hypothetical protein GJAV_G00159950 [Gymnothorax javanicus]